MGKSTTKPTRTTHDCYWGEKVKRGLYLGTRATFAWRKFFPSLILLVTVALSFISLDTVAAQSAEPKIVEQQDLDGNGTPDLTVINIYLATSNDKVYVYDGGNDMLWTDEWSMATDFIDDTWVFNVEDDEAVELIINFYRNGESTTAKLFHDLNGDGEVAHTIKEGIVTVTESNNSPLKITVEGDWYLPDGKLNWNTLFQTDGASVNHVHPYDLSTPWHPILELDGDPDIELEFRDDDLDGVPEYGLWRLLATNPDTARGTRTWIWSNEARQPPVQSKEFGFWPYLATGGADRYFDKKPTLEMDWLASRILHVSFSGYPIEHGFHVNTLQGFTKNERNLADFENIQAYYDLANNEDGNPELHIRHLYFPAGSQYAWNLPTPINEIRWSWNQSLQTDLIWDYKLGLAGRHEITSTVSFPDFSYETIPYGELPSWIVDKQWDMATLVAREDATFASSEGIYAWSPIDALVDDDPSTLSRYIAGQSEIDPRQAFKKMDVGWRGEFAPNLVSQPQLYFSPIDHRLHLLKAEYGIWTIDSRSLMHYADKDEDGYFDQWLYMEDSEVRQQLSLSDHYSIFGDDNQVRLKQAKIASSNFEGPPPINHDDWLKLGEHLEANKKELDNIDLRTIATRFPGPELQILKGNMRDYRPTRDGFRFVLTLRPGFETTGTLDMLDLSSQSPGEYLVTYDGSFSVESLRPPPNCQLIYATQTILSCSTNLVPWLFN